MWIYDDAHSERHAKPHACRSRLLSHPAALEARHARRAGVARRVGRLRGVLAMGNTFRWQARHTVLSILFATWIVSYLDRIVMSVAIPYIAADYHLSPLAMGIVMSVFFAGYSISQIPGGVLADKFGVRKVATLAMLWWSVFTAATGAAGNLTQMLIIRFVFGLGEGVFP